MREFPTNGPFPTDFIVTHREDHLEVFITYDEFILYNPGENSGFFVCCEKNSSSSCDGDVVHLASDWQLLPMSAVTQVSGDSILVVLDNCGDYASLGYLWAESPVVSLHGLPLYSLDQYGLPAPPWWKHIQ